MTSVVEKVLVTGGAGFIGSHIVDQLVRQGVDVVVLDSLAADVHPTRPDYLNPCARYVVGDVADEAGWRRAIDGVDAVCHQAARVGLGVDFGDVGRYVTDNDVGTAVGLSVLHDIGFDGRIVLASSMVVYGEGRYRCDEHGRAAAPPRHPDRLTIGEFEPTCPTCDRSLAWDLVTEDDPVDPRNVYAATKLHQEHLCGSFGREHGVPVTALRYHNVYGPRMPRDTQYAGVASLFRSSIDAGVAPKVFEDGGQMRDFVHVDDVAAANIAALLTDEPVDGPLNVASGEPRSVLDLARRLADKSSQHLEPVVTGGFRLGDVRHVVASARRATERLGFRAAVGFDDGMARFAADPLR